MRTKEGQSEDEVRVKVIKNIYIVRNISSGRTVDTAMKTFVGGKLAKAK